MQEYTKGMKKSYFIYRISCRDTSGKILYKVGFTGDPVRRLICMQVDCPFSLYEAALYRVSGKASARSCESRCHVRLESRHHRGEWFIADEGDDGSMMAMDSVYSIVCEHQKKKVPEYRLPIDLIIKGKNPISWGKI